MNALAIIEQKSAALTAARKALFEANDILDVVKLKAGASGVEAAMAPLMKLHADADQVRKEAAEFCLRCKRRIGELLATMERHPQGGDQRKKQSSSALLCSPTLADLGLDKFEASRCQRIAEIPEAVFEQTIADHMAAGKLPTQEALLRLAPASKATVEVGQEPHLFNLLDRLFDWNRRFMRDWPHDQLDDLRKAYEQLRDEVQ